MLVDPLFSWLPSWRTTQWKKRAPLLIGIIVSGITDKEYADKEYRHQKSTVTGGALKVPYYARLNVPVSQLPRK